MIRKIEHFCKHFADFQDAYALIGGAACTAWYSGQEIPFRATTDLDIVLVLENLDVRFAEALKDYIEQCGYRIREQVELEGGLPTRRILYRFSNPTDAAAPAQLELLSRRSENMHLSPQQHTAPLKAEEYYLGLSCILLDDEYYHFFRRHLSRERGIPRPTLAALIALKIKAYLNLAGQYRAEAPHGSDQSRANIRKHRNDVFFLLFDVYPAQDALELPLPIRRDVEAFLQAHAPDSPAWSGIFAHLEAKRGKDATEGITPQTLLNLLQELFHL